MIGLYTSEKEVIDLAIPLFRVISVAFLIDSLNMPVLGCVRGLGIQLESSIISIATMLVVGIPMAYYFAFNLEVGIIGFWIGIYSGIILQFILNFILICQADWRKIAEDSELRMISK